MLNFLISNFSPKIGEVILKEKYASFWILGGGAGPARIPKFFGSFFGPFFGHCGGKGGGFQKFWGSFEVVVS